MERHRPSPNFISEIKKSVIVSEISNVECPKFRAISSPAVSFLDLRSRIDFKLSHVHGALNLPLQGITADTKSPFDFEDTSMLLNQWTELQSIFQSDEFCGQLSALQAPIVVLCYNGDTSRMATANLRAKGIEAYSFMHGMPGLKEFLDRENLQEHQLSDGADCVVKGSVR